MVLNLRGPEASLSLIFSLVLNILKCMLAVK